MTDETQVQQFDGCRSDRERECYIAGYRSGGGIAEEEFRTLLGANEGESTVDALHRYTAAVQLGCALKLEQRAKEVAESVAAALVVGAQKSIIVAALVGGAAFIRQGVVAETQQPTRYSCSPTCTHDDAATPGHPERVTDLSDSVTRDALMGDGFEKGAEAMRAACWEAADKVCQTLGWTGHLRDAFKSAIEGASP